MTIINVAGSHGSLQVNRETGEIIGTNYGCDACGECGWVGPHDEINGQQAYPEIKRFDPATLPDHDEDILRVGYWWERGTNAKGYETPVPRDEADYR